MNVGKYKANRSITIDKKLILEGDILFLEKPDGVSGWQKLSFFNEARELIAVIRAEDFYTIEKAFTELHPLQAE